MLKIAIVSGPENGSPKVLSATLEKFILNTGNYARKFYRVKALTRLFPAKTVNENKLLWIVFKLLHFIGDSLFFSSLKNFDAVIVCSCTPYAFYKHSYNVKAFKKKIDNKPVLYYAVQYLENSPTIKKRLVEGGHDLLGRYDWHLTVSPITELRGTPAPPWSQIGLYLKSSGLVPMPRKEFLVVVDFLRPGYEQYREIQLKVLKELNIAYISLEKPYSMEEIRAIYQKASVYFIQFPEAYGMPIAECLACGSYIGTPHSAWAMSWRLDEKVEVHGPGTLPECFLVYDNEDDLREKLIVLRDKYHLENTPKAVFDNFFAHYPSFYDGNMPALKEVLGRIESGTITHPY
ncbi:MAG: hypothetical protein JXB34_12625 [Bacteroidales bacterium]|nr:hypothetical protein [Bacteroidales bacterium]